ncbi:MAG: hypothetical protein R3185_02350 [Candidatus Thermoplasmatota archaeon]|nr:hypothetical protein [Candidatus Thermoplasmatota archaeon]
MPADNLEDDAARLRASALNHPTVLSLGRDLPSLPREGPVEPGLYLDKSKVPGILVNGEVRVSLARIFSVDPSGKRQLIGQVQATRVRDHPLETWELRYYVHVHKFYATHKVDDETQWFLQVLEQHYKAGGDEVDLTAEIEA